MLKKLKSQEFDVNDMKMSRNYVPRRIGGRTSSKASCAIITLKTIAAENKRQIKC